MNIEVKELDGSIGVQITDGTTILVEQNFNPETGAPFASSEEAQNWALAYIQELNPEPILGVEATLLDATDQEITTCKVGDPIKIRVKLYNALDGSLVPVTGKFFVPIKDKFNDIIISLVEVDLTNGEGVETITIKNPGLFTADVEKMLSGQTMEPPNPYPKEFKVPSVIITEE